ncbi:MAG: matrixin family metalloprotease [Patescibacteria group bacterium]|jgi:predicted Zn-dependent protease
MADQKLRKKILPNLLAITIFLSLIYYFQTPLLQDWKLIADYFTPPCQKPISYRLGAIDQRFNLTEKDLLAAAKQAADIWSEPINRPLFNYSTTGEIKINLIYDYRQEATDKLKKLGIEVKDDKNSYDSLKLKYDASVSQYNNQKAALETLISSYEQKQAAYNARVKSWNDRGGAPAAVYEQLNQEKKSLNDLAAKINSQAAKVNDLVDNLNAEATILNKLITELNLTADKYNGVNSTLGGEFNEGVYQQDESGQAINIYEFDNQQRLIRLLAHELGHALGLEHTDNPSDIMYRLNQGTNEKLTDTDLAALKNACKIE